MIYTTMELVLVHEDLSIVGVSSVPVLLTTHRSSYRSIRRTD